jgi:hypothetical protein
MTADRPPVDLSHVAGGTTLLLAYLTLIPGFLPTLVLTIAFVVIVLLPAVVLGIVAAVVIGAPYGLWRVATRGRRRARAPTIV